MSDYKVIFLDIDGTIIGPDDTIEESTKQAIAEVQRKGLEVFLATGRPIHEIQEIAKSLNIHSFIGYNGALGIYKGKELFKKPMASSTIENFLTLAKNHKHEVVLYTDELNGFSSLNTPMINKFIKKFHLKNNELFSPDIFDKVLGMTLINLKENDYLHYQMDDGIHLSQVNIEGMRHCFDVIRDTVNKGIGVSIVLEHLHIAKEGAIAFGDGMNDKEMLRNVNHGFAMGNAHPDLFTYARYRTTNVNDSGIFNGLKMLGLVDEC